MNKDDDDDDEEDDDEEMVRITMSSSVCDMRDHAYELL